MAHRQYPPHHHQPYGAVELDTTARAQLHGEIFEMPGESMVLREEKKVKSRKPVQAQDGDVTQANPWPFYLDQDVRTESRVDAEEDKKKPGRMDGKSEEQQQQQQTLANPWAYFGPVTPDEEDESKASSAAAAPSPAAAAAAAAGPGVDALGIKAGDSGNAEAQNGDLAAAPPPLRLSSHGEPAGDGPSPALAARPAVSDSSAPPPVHIAPLRLPRKQVPGASAAAPAFKPYLPPEESAVTPVAPLNVKHEWPVADGPQGDGPAGALSYRPYRPAGREDDDVAAAAAVPLPSPSPAPPQPVLSPPPQEPPVMGHVPRHAAPHAAPQETPSQATPLAKPTSPDPTQQQQQQQQHQQPQQPAANLSASTEAPLAGAASPHQHQQPNQPPPPATAGPPLPPPVTAPLVPPAASPMQTPAPVVAVAGPPTIAAPTPYHGSAPPVPPHPAPPGTPYQPSPTPSMPGPVAGYPQPLPSPSHAGPAMGYPPHSSPMPGQPAYAPPHSAPTSAVPSPQMASFQFQPINQGHPQSPYPGPTPTPPMAMQAPPSPIPYPPHQQFTPPLPASGYDIPQPTYAPANMNPPHQPPRPEFQQAAMGAYQQYPQSQPSPTYGYAGPPRPGTQPPPATHPHAYNAPYGPAIAPHQHHYPTQATYATPNGNVPPLPPRPATTQPQILAGFTPQVVAYPPPPRKVFSPPPAGPPAAPQKPSGGMSSSRLFSSSSALKWIDRTGKGLESKLDAVLGSQGSSNKPPLPPRPS